MRERSDQVSEADEYGPGGDRESGPQSEDAIRGSATLEELLDAGLVESALLLKGDFTADELELIRQAYEFGCVAGKQADDRIAGASLVALIRAAHARGVEEGKTIRDDLSSPASFELLSQLREEFESLALMSYHGATDAVPTIWMADITKEGVERLRDLLRSAGARIMTLDQSAYEAAKREMAAAAELSSYVKACEPIIGYWRRRILPENEYAYIQECEALEDYCLQATVELARLGGVEIPDDEED